LSPEQDFLLDGKNWRGCERAPVGRGKKLLDTSVMQIGRIEIDQALHKFARCWAHFGTLPWVDSAPITEFDDSEFPAYLAA
jgi:hypothetical protein